ncbi:hypothetical protein EBZ37_04010 [bacterium]|nr:hypothetical protein [bacterium]
MSNQYLCPNCASALESVPIDGGALWTCFTCKGRAIGIGLLNRISDSTLIQEIWIRAKSENSPTGKPCPLCRRLMLNITTGPKLGTVTLDVCQICYWIWFDPGELDKLPRSKAK